MPPRPHPRPRRITVVLSALALAATGLWAGPASAALPAQEPGVTLRVFDVQTPLSTICTLKPAQTPNVDKLMPTDQLDDRGRLRLRRQLRLRRPSATSTSPPPAATPSG